MAGLRFSSGGKAARGLSTGENPGFVVNETALVAAPSITPNQVDKDIIYTLSTGTSTDNNCRLDTALPTTWVNSTPAICSIDTGGNIARVANGLCSVIGNTSKGSSGFNRMMLRDLATLSTRALTSYAATSVAKNIKDNIDALISGKTPGLANQRIWAPGSVFNVDAPVAVANPSYFAPTFDLSATSFCSNEQGQPGYYHLMRNHLVSPRHVIRASHVAASTKLVWRRPDGTFTAPVNVLRYDVIDDDLTVGYLDAPVTGITPYSILPDNYASYLPSVNKYTDFDYPNKAAYLPTLSVGANSYTYSQLRIFTTSSISTSTAFIDQTFASAYAAWSNPVLVGDSSHATFYPIFDGVSIKPVLLMTYFSFGVGPNIVKFAAAINARMNAQAALYADATVYALTRVNLAGYTAY